MPCSQILLYPDSADAKDGNLLYRDSSTGSVQTMCLSRPNDTDGGCKDPVDRAVVARNHEQNPAFRQIWCRLGVAEYRDGKGGGGRLELETSTSSVSSLALLACGLGPSALKEEAPDPAVDPRGLWRNLKVKTSMEIMATLTELRNQRRHGEATRFFRRALVAGAVLCTSRLAFSSKVRQLTNLVEMLQTDVARECPGPAGRADVARKIRRILDLNFYDCDPKCPNPKVKTARPSPTGVSVLDRHGLLRTGKAAAKALNFLCCLCPSESCSGECAEVPALRDVPRVKTVTAAKNTKAARRRTKELDNEVSKDKEDVYSAQQVRKRLNSGN